ncbi:MAG: TRAP transporter TatT component family protein [Burkholderiales bacterium]|nr:TRAP transporter TatT component family protein [Burkholderiales bacterium]
MNTQPRAPSHQGAAAGRQWRWARRVLGAALTIGLAGCAPQALLVRAAADQLAGQGRTAEDDLVLAREASAFYLKLSESVLAQSPGHLALAESVAAGFTQYAYAFVAFEADRLESTDARAALRLRQRAARLYLRAHVHAMNALDRNNPALRAALARTNEPAQTIAALLPAEQVGVAYWAAASWAAYISLSKDRPETIADLPQAVRLARLAWERSPAHGEGALSSLMGSLEAARPGGSPQQAARYFDRAIADGAGRNAGAYLAKAEALSLPAGDRAGFEALLQQALAAAETHRDLGNEVARERANWLLQTIDDRF